MKTYDTICGIYNTEYRLISHRDGSYTVKAPYIKWVGNSGSLAFKMVKIIKFRDIIADAFDGFSEMTVSEIVYCNEN